MLDIQGVLDFLDIIYTVYLTYFKVLILLIDIAKLRQLVVLKSKSANDVNLLQ